MQTTWPSDELEAVPACPVCGGERREVLHAGLTDGIFFTAPGSWTLHRCLDCRSGFLDPRPERASIGRAYARYYTHCGAVRGRPELRLAGARQAVRDGYLNSRYGYAFAPAWERTGAVVARVLPKRRWYADGWVRRLPAPRPGARLLDVGCGEGSFLATMRDAGWAVQGLEPDPAAAEVTRSRGIPVEEAPIEAHTLPSGSFDALTMSHVLEHVHDPRGALRACRELLRPGGILWLATPNLDARGHARFGPAWIGLDPPRHLCIFTRASLLAALREAGFAVVEVPRDYSAEQTFVESAAVAAGEDPQGPAVSGRRLGPIRTLLADLAARLRPATCEALEVVARAE